MNGAAPRSSAAKTKVMPPRNPPKKKPQDPPKPTPTKMPPKRPNNSAKQPKKYALKNLAKLRNTHHPPRTSQKYAYKSKSARSAASASKKQARRFLLVSESDSPDSYDSDLSEYALDVDYVKLAAERKKNKLQGRKMPPKSADDEAELSDINIAFEFDSDRADEDVGEEVEDFDVDSPDFDKVARQRRLTSLERKTLLPIRPADLDLSLLDLDNENALVTDLEDDLLDDKELAKRLDEKEDDEIDNDQLAAAIAADDEPDAYDDETLAKNKQKKMAGAGEETVLSDDDELLDQETRNLLADMGQGVGLDAFGVGDSLFFGDLDLPVATFGIVESPREVVKKDRARRKSEKIEEEDEEEEEVLEFILDDEKKDKEEESEEDEDEDLEMDIQYDLYHTTKPGFLNLSSSGNRYLNAYDETGDDAYFWDYLLGENKGSEKRRRSHRASSRRFSGRAGGTNFDLALGANDSFMDYEAIFLEEDEATDVEENLPVTSKKSLGSRSAKEVLSLAKVNGGGAPRMVLWNTRRDIPFEIIDGVTTRSILPYIMKASVNGGNHKRNTSINVDLKFDEFFNLSDLEEGPDESVDWSALTGQNKRKVPLTAFRNRAHLFVQLQGEFPTRRMSRARHSRGMSHSKSLKIRKQIRQSLLGDPERIVLSKPSDEKRKRRQSLIMEATQEGLVFTEGGVFSEDVLVGVERLLSSTDRGDLFEI